MKTVILSLFGILLSAHGYAGSTVCSSADQSVFYDDYASDGGAFRFTTSIRFNGVDVYHSINYHPAEGTVGFQFEGEPTYIAGPKSMDGEISSTYVQKLILTEKDNVDAKLFSDFVLCHYYAKPCLFCP